MNNEVKIHNCGQSAGKTVVTENEKWFLAGLIEGEGSFCVSLKWHKCCRYGIHVDPEFFIYQHQIRRDLLERAKLIFNTGHIGPKSGTPDVLVYKVNCNKRIIDTIIPFLNQYMTYSSRKNDIEKFKKIVYSWNDKKHLTKDKVIEIVQLAYTMNMNGKNRKRNIEEVINRILRDYTLSTN